MYVKKNSNTHLPLVFALALFIKGCATYQTPGAGINIGNLAKADGDIAEVMKREPAAPFPSRIAMVRVQSTGYHSRNNHCYGEGAFAEKHGNGALAE